MTPLEPRDTPLSLLWYGEPIAAVDALAARIDTPETLPALPAFDAITPWGRVEVQGVPADTLAVFVGPVVNPAHLGEGGPVSWQVQGGEPLSRSPGMVIGLRVDPEYDAATVASHEFLHGIGIDYHLPQPALLAAETPPDIVRGVTPADIVAIRDAGLEFDDSGLPYHRQPFHGGWVSLPLNVAADWIEAETSGVNSIPEFTAVDGTVLTIGGR